MKQNEKSQEDEEEGESHRFGYFGCTPSWLQVFNSTRWLLVCVMWSALVQGFIINGINNVNVSTLERRFDMTSSQVAWISSTYDLGAGVFAFLFGYLGVFIHKGRMIAVSTLFLSLGSFMMLLPHLLDGEYKLGPLQTDLCNPSGNSTLCDESQSSLSNYVWMFVIGQLCNAVGGAAIYTLSIPYMDENIKTKNAPIYIGLMQSCSVMGPGLGFIIGGLLLNIYVDAGRVDMDEIDITPNDPRWVGAWWIGFAFGSIAFLTVSAFFAGFPRKLPAASHNTRDRTSEAYKGRGDKETAEQDYGKSFKDFLNIMKILFTNPVWVCLSIAGIVEYGAIIGFATFLPKIIQFQFSQSPAMAAVWAGIVVVPAALIGHLLGGLIPRRYGAKLKGLLIQSAAVNLISVFVMFQFLLRCDMVDFAGVNVQYSNRSFGLESPDLNSNCNDDCQCTTYSYDPVCGADGVQYFSPCYAGCLGESDESYHNCSCIDITRPAQSGIAEDSVCTQECSVLPAFLVLFFIVNLTTFMTATTGQTATIRCVPDKQRSFAHGVQSTLIRYLGNVPGPIIFGAIFDSSCWVWQEYCNIKGSCWIYDSSSVAVGVTIIGVVVKATSFICLTIAVFSYKPPTDVSTVSESEIKPSNGITETKLNVSVIEKVDNRPNIQETDQSYQYGDFIADDYFTKL